MRKPVAIAGLLCGALLLAGCASENSVNMGESLKVKLAGTDNIKTTMTVTNVTAVPTSEVQEVLQLPESYSNGTVFLVNYDVQLAEGEYSPQDDGDYPLSHYNWSAKAANNAQVAVFEDYFIDPEEFAADPVLADCKLFTTSSPDFKLPSDISTSLAKGDKISPCIIFASQETNAQLESVTYLVNKISIKRNRTKNPEWKVTNPLA